MHHFYGFHSCILGAEKLLSSIGVEGPGGSLTEVFEEDSVGDMKIIVLFSFVCLSC